MTVLFVDLEPAWRGGQNQLYLALRGLCSRGHRVELLARDDCPLGRRAQAEGIAVHSVRGPATRLRAALLLRRLLAHQGFDILHANEPHALTAAWLAGAQHRLAVVVSRRVGFPLQKNPVTRARYRAARLVVAVSQFVADRVVASGVPAGSVEIVHDGIEVPPLPSPETRRQARQRWGVSEGETLLGCVGYLVPQKGHEAVIAALAELRAQGLTCRLLLAGDGPTRKDLERLARNRGVESAVRFMGFVEDAAAVYAAVDVFVFPSREEALGSALLTAMAYELPVVALSSGGVPELVADGQNGLLVSEFDSGAFAAAVARLLTDAELRRRLGRAARETIKERFTAEQMVSNTLRLYERLQAASPRD